MIKWKPDIILDHVTEEMREWLEENCKGKYSIKPHMIRFRYAGPRVPLSKCQRQEGWQLWFDDELAVAFKLRWT